MSKNKIKEIIGEIKNEKSDNLVNKYKKNFIKILSNLSNEEVSCLEELVRVTMETGNEELIDCFVITLISKKKILNFKKNGNIINEMLKIIIKKRKEAKENVEIDYFFQELIEKIMDLIDSLKQIEKYKSFLLEIICLSLTHGPLLFKSHTSALSIINKYPWNKNDSAKVMRLVIDYVELYGSSPEGSGVCCLVNMFLVFAYFMKGNDLENHLEVLPEVTGVVEKLLVEDWENEEDPSQGNMRKSFLHDLLEYYMRPKSQTKVELVKPIYKKLKNTFENTTLDDSMETVIKNILVEAAEEAMEEDQDLSMLIQQFLQGEMDSFANKLKDVYLAHPEQFEEYLVPLSDLLEKPKDQTSSQLITFFTEVAKKDTKKLPPSLFDHMTKLLSHQWWFSLVLMFFDAVASTDPEVVMEKEEALLECGIKNENSCSLVSGLLPKLAINKEKSDFYLNYLKKEAIRRKETAYVTCYLSNMRLIGHSYLESLKPYKKFFQEMKNIPNCQDICLSTIDLIEGRSLETVHKQANENKDKIVKIEDDVSEAREQLEIVTDDVSTTKKTLNVVREDVETNKKNIEEVKSELEKTNERIKQIDSKTLSHAPVWARKVSLILSSPENQETWKLLAYRLGYKKEDVISWSSHSDPCLLMFDDWFANYGTKEGTKAVEKQLEELDQLEALQVVREVLDEIEKQHNGNEKEEELVSRTNVFLSYQWAHQPQVKLIKLYLETAGFKCWMDIGQMGGGDKLYDEINKGMRRCRVVLSCLTQKYAESPNCNREVNLAIALNKPMIPLMIEKSPWPPEGGMGVVMGEFLFIRFYKREGEKSSPAILGSEEPFWPEVMFNQLLSQMEKFKDPDLDGAARSIKKEKNDDKNKKSLVPVAFLKKNSKKLLKKNVDDNEKEKNKYIYDIFISCVCEDQDYVSELVNELTNRGFSVFSEFVKNKTKENFVEMNKKMRGSRLVICCFTSKYSQSRSSRREISLCEAIKKPIILLLMDSKGWPPEEPLASTLASSQLIDFTKPDKEKNLLHLISKIDTYCSSANKDVDNQSFPNSFVEKNFKNIVKTKEKKDKNNNVPRMFQNIKKK